MGSLVILAINVAVWLAGTTVSSESVYLPIVPYSPSATSHSSFSLSPPDFVEALTGPLAAIFGYRPKSAPGAIVAIRFPKELADALQFEPVGDVTPVAIPAFALVHLPVTY